MLTDKDIKLLYQNARKTMCKDDMEILMHLLHSIPDRIQFLPKPLSYYAQGHTKQRIATGNLKGMEGYVMRISRDRKMVMGIGSITLAICDVHKEQMEEIL